jgi:4-amino-4-deoxy-L-arabinose transferase-like glycosyltransferase
MSTIPALGPEVGQVRSRSAVERYAVPAAVVVAVLARLPFLTRPPSKDEAGFLTVGQQWHAGGTSLYGNYWVDRPPLLITIFRIAADLGGLVPLRLIGCLATALVVLGSAHVARQIAGERAARWAALTAAALCLSPLLGALAVNGELLSAPFVVGGMAAALAVTRHRTEGRAALAAGLAGAAMVAALLVKQNIADVGIFAVIVVLLAWRRGEITSARLRRCVAAFGAGSLLSLGVVAGWTMLHGTTVTGVFDAMYPFRVEAGRVMANSNRQAADARLWVLVSSWLVSGGAVIMSVVSWALVSRRLRGAAVWGLVGTFLFDVVSIALGGSYWNHYLVQLVVPTAVISGLLVAKQQPAARTLLSASAVAAAIALGVMLPQSGATIGTSVGQAVGRVAVRHDTIVTVYGHADVTHASGLSSPYPYLWSLPARTLDPRRAALHKLLSGPDAPTWFVSWKNVSAWTGMHSTATARLLTQRYRPVARLYGRTVYLRKGVYRPAPQLPGTEHTGTVTTSPATTSAREWPWTPWTASSSSPPPDP